MGSSIQTSSFLYNWINPELIRQGASKQLIAISKLHFIFITVSILCTPLFYYNSFIEGAIIMAIIIPASMFHLLLMRFSSNTSLITNYFWGVLLMISLALLVFSGGVGSPYGISFFAIGPPAFFVFKEKAALQWVGLTTFLFFAVGLLQIFGIQYQTTASDSLIHYIWIIVFTGNSIMVMLVVLSYSLRNQSNKRKVTMTNKGLQESNEELERFAFIASHDLKSPLRSVINFSNMLDKKYKERFDHKGQQFLGIIHDNAERMEALITDILEFSKTKNHQPKIESIDLNDLVKEIATNIKTANLYPKGQIFYNNLLTISSDETLIKQLLQNLIENGLKYNDSNAPTIHVNTALANQFIEISIKDNGIGMEPQYHERIFEMFQRLHNKDEYNGTGIGLAVCKKIVTTLEGRITVESAIDEGSTFKIFLPNKTQKQHNNK